MDGVKIWLSMLFIVCNKLVTQRKPIAADANAPLDSNAARRKIGRKELEKHNTKEDCWVAINDLIYE